MPDFQVNSAVPSSAIFTAGPIGDHILVRPIERSHMVGGMQIADTTVERPSEGVVLAVGPGRVTESGVRIEPEVRVNDHVLFPSFAGRDKEVLLSIDGGPEETLLLMRQDELCYNHGPYQPERSSETHE